jgi:hypothetical protein
MKKDSKVQQRQGASASELRAGDGPALSARNAFRFRKIFVLFIAAALLYGAGCQTDIPPSDEDVTSAPVEAFGPTSMRINPVFTQIKNWSSGKKPDGIEIVLEFQDRFHDPTKAIGRAVFELYAFRQTAPDQKGDRLSNPWIGSLMNIPDQEAHWDRTSRAYTFQLVDPKVSVTQNYVLTASFEQQGGGRFFDQIVLQGKKARLNKLKLRGKAHT